MSKAIQSWFVGLFLGTFFVGTCFAVKGDIAADLKQIQGSTCRLAPRFQITYGRGPKAGTSERVDGECSSVRILDDSTLLTAKHCLLLNPMATRQLHALDNKYLDEAEVKVHCKGAQNPDNQIVGFEVHPHLDLAVVKIRKIDGVDAGLVRPLGFVEDSRFGDLPQKSSAGACASYGYGRNNDDQYGRLGGVVITEAKAIPFQETTVLKALEYDFMSLAMYYAHSMTATRDLIISKDSLPYLFREGATIGLDADAIKVRFDDFFEQLHRNNIDQMDIFSSEKGPQFESYFKNYFYGLYKSAFSELVEKNKSYRIEKGIPLVALHLNTQSKTGERSGIDSGDSGGPFVCEDNGQHRLYGIHSMRSASEFYTAKPWEPMYYKPEERETKDGVSVAITESVQKWIHSTAKKLIGPKR